MKSPRSRLSAPRLWLSRRELVCRGETVLQSHFSLDISVRYFEIAPRSRLSRHERVWRGEIALRSRRDISKSRRDGRYLAENRFASPRATFLGAIFWNLAEIVAKFFTRGKPLIPFTAAHTHLVWIWKEVAPPFQKLSDGGRRDDWVSGSFLDLTLLAAQASAREYLSPVLLLHLLHFDA